MKVKTLPLTVQGAVILMTLALLFISSSCTTTSSQPTAAPTTPTVTLPPAPQGNGAAVFKKGVPGGIIVNTVEVSAKITALDPANRKVTLLRPDGKKVTVKLGPEAVNYDQLKVGDMVNATLTEELLVYLDGKEVSASDGSAGMVALAPKGAQPGAVIADTIQITARVVAIDTVARTATLEFEDNSLKTIPVRGDIDLSRRKVGEKVVFQVTEIIAIQVEKP